MQSAHHTDGLFRWAGHTHVFRSGSAARSIPEWSRELRRRLNFFGFGHPWDADDLGLVRAVEGDPGALAAYFKRNPPLEETLRPGRFARWRRECGTEDFLCAIELETPKVRYGHLWWLDWQPLHAPWHDYDQSWGHWEGAGRKGNPPPFDRRMPAEVVREQCAVGAVPVYAHPTSWWTGPHGQFVTNIAATLVPDLLSGQFRGALAVMGYDARHDSYRALWFDLLNRGWFLPGVAETDACLDATDPFRDGLLHNVCPMEKPWTPGKLKQAVMDGSGTMTSGPLLELRCGTTQPGGRVAETPARVTATTRGLRPATPYTLAILANGKPVASQCATTAQPDASFELSAVIESAGWVLATLDGPDPRREAAITNPILIGPGIQCLNALPHAPKPPAYWSDPAAIRLLDYLIHGEFRRDFPGLEPGQVPPEAFRFDDWTKVIGNLLA